MEIDIKNEETSADQEKNIDELRSPSPSESVNNTDLVYSCNDLTNGLYILLTKKIFFTSQNF